MTYRYPKALIIQFAKAPIVGEVKTRMQPHLNAEQCTELHRRLVNHTFHTLITSQLAPVELWVAGDDREAFFERLCAGGGPCGLSLVAVLAQQGSDLGSRMFAAFEHSLPRSHPVILVGSDCPFFSKDYLVSTIELLLGGQDAVLGPAEDGGYVMIGLNRVSPLLFRDVDWGSAQVLAQTRKRLLQLAWSWREMPPLSDIDEPVDLIKIEKLGIL